MHRVEKIFKFKFLLIILLSSYSFSQEKVSLQLKWLHQFQFAGYYAAKEKGFYAAEGLDVEIKERDLEYNNVAQVIDGESEYGIADSVLFLYKMKDEPIVIISPIFQHSPSVLISLKNKKINSPYDLNNKNVLFYENDTDSFTILAMLKKLEIKPTFFRKRNKDDYLKLLNDEIDFVPAYLSNELYYFKEKNIALNVINPMHYGFDLYGDMLFTNKDEVVNHPNRVEKFKNATLRGWEYALDNKEEIIQLIHKKYNSEKSIEHLRYEANVVEDMIDRKKVVLGDLDKGRFQYILQIYEDYGLSEDSSELKDFIFEEFTNRLKLSKEELEYLNKKKKLTYCIDPNWLPFEKNLEGKHVGISADYIKLFEEKLSVPFKFIQTNTWSESLSLVKDRKCDILSMVMETEERNKFLNFTKPYIETPLVLITKNEEFYISNIEDVIHKKLGIVRNYAYIDILKNKYPNINLVEVDNVQMGLEKVKNSELYGFIDNLTTTAFEIQNKYMGQLIVSNKFDEIWHFSLGSRNDEPLLNSILNKLVEDINFEKKHQIFNKWISLNIEDKINYKLIIEWVLSVVFIFSIILFIFIYANIKLKKEIKKRKKIEKRLKSFNTLIDEHIISSSTDLNGIITDISSAYCKISKYSSEELIGQNQNIVRHPDMSKEFFNDLWKTIKSNNIWYGEIKNKAKDGTYYWIFTTISPKYDEFNNKVGYISIRHDITDKKLIEELSITDGLTNIYNRRHFNDTFPKFINGAKRDEQYISFLILDVDFFKQYNDTYGHQKGDDVLKDVSKCLKESTNRIDDYCFRLGGEEFGILFKSKSKENSIIFANKILNNIEDLKIEHKSSKISKYITVSMGLYTNKANHIPDNEDVYRDADKMLYKAKKSGRNRVVSN
ncbi:MAG: diguanylate cyclase [Aliarcobacter sp.]|jgi:diguanylate cyclase (GGDEF)-like protein/PAS domain S-box-containing protein|nr:diguanylate cyclase [Aliarcobacter sp.]